MEISKAFIGSSSANPSLDQLARDVRAKQYTDAAKSAAQADSFSSAANMAFKNLDGVTYQPGADTAPESAPTDRPQLAPPPQKLPADTKQKMDIFTLLMAELSAIMGDSDIKSRQARVDILKNFSKATTESYLHRSAQYEGALGQLEAALAAASGSEERLLAARAQVEAAQQNLDAAEATLAGLDPNSPEYAAAVANRDAARTALTGARNALPGIENEHTQNMARAREAVIEANKLGVGLAVPIGKPLPQAVEQNMRREMDAQSTMILLMMMFAELMGDAENLRMETDTALFKAMQKVRQAYLEEKAVEYAKAVEDAAKMSKIAGCIGKILGGVIAAIGVIVTVASLGTASPVGVAIAAIGIGLTMSDLIYQGVTGESFVGNALAPLINAVIMPIIKLMIELTTKLLNALDDAGVLGFLGLPDNFAEIGGVVLGTLYALTAIIALAAVGMMVGGPLAGKLMDKIANSIGPMLAKMVPEILKHVANVAMDTLDDVFKHFVKALSTEKSQQIINVTRAATVGLEMNGTIVRSGFEAASGVNQKKAAEAMAEVSVIQFITELLKEVMAKSVDKFGATSEEITRYIEGAMDVLRQQGDTATSMTRKI